MKLFTKDIDTKLFEQYAKGSDLENQMVVAKIFNPYGSGTWYLLNSDPEDPEYLWAIVDMSEIEVGSVNRSDLENIRIKPFMLGLERDLSFRPVNALELYKGMNQGKLYAKGGGVDNENREMVLNNNKQIAHHTKEMSAAVRNSKYVPAWVVAKVNRSATDLSDATHYIEGEGKSYAIGGGVEYKMKMVSFPEDKTYKYYVVNEDTDNYLTVQTDMFDKWKNANQRERAEYYSEWIPKSEMIEVMATGGGVDDSVNLLREKIRNASSNMYEGAKSNVVYFGSNDKLKLDNYTDLIPYSAQGYTDEVQISFNSPNKTMITFSNKVLERFEDRKSFEKYGGIIYIYEPLTKKIASNILKKVDLLKKYATGGNTGGTSDSAEMNAPTLGGTMTSSMATGGVSKKEFIAKKVGKVMREFKEGDLHIGTSNKIVKNPKQAIAIALSEGKRGWKHNKGGMSESAKQGKIDSVLDKKWSFDDGVDTYRNRIKKGIYSDKQFDGKEYSLIEVKSGKKVYQPVTKTVYDYFEKSKNSIPKEEIFEIPKITKEDVDSFYEIGQNAKFKKSDWQEWGNPKNWSNSEMRDYIDTELGYYFGEEVKYLNKEEFDQWLTNLKNEAGKEYENRMNQFRTGGNLHGGYIITDSNEQFYLGTYGDMGEKLTWVEEVERANHYNTYEEAKKVAEKKQQGAKVIEYKTGGATTKQQEKIGKVMKEFKEGTLHSGKSDKVVKNPKQAIAIGLSEGNKGWKHRRK